MENFFAGVLTGIWLVLAATILFGRMGVDDDKND